MKEHLKQIDVGEFIWWVPKFHQASHIDTCVDYFSFNWTHNIGRTCGELVKANWSGLNGLTTSTKEMRFGHSPDALNDAHFVCTLSRFLV